jgi:hypothetical protein
MRGEMVAFSGFSLVPHTSPFAIKRRLNRLRTSWFGFRSVLRIPQLHAESMAPLILSFSPKGRRDRKVTLHLPRTWVEHRAGRGEKSARRERGVECRRLLGEGRSRSGQRGVNEQ